MTQQATVGATKVAGLGSAHQVALRSLAELDPTVRRGLFRLRAEVFAGRLGWDVQITPDGLERDAFDDLPEARYVFATSARGTVDACWRLLPTRGPNMLADTFPELLGGLPAPCSSDCWELSRFAIATDRLAASEDAGNPQIGFGELSIALMVQAWQFAQACGIARYVTVTTAAIERMLKKQGLSVRRLSAPVRVGSVLTVACFIEVDEVTRAALFG